ncbi:MAG: hypothetical protein AAFN77_02360 [Planctomycetota bacterium]
MKRIIGVALVAVIAVPLMISGIFASPAPPVEDGLPKGIAFYGVLKDGLMEAEATNRPILFLSAAPQCAGVPGMW